MATLQISKVFPFQPTPARVSQKVAEHIDNLIEHGFDRGKILDIYIESQKLACGFRNITNPMRYMAAYLGAGKGNSDICLRELEQIYKDTVQAWSNIEPKDFLQQFDAYVNQGVNDTGLENGMIREHFLSFSIRDEKLLVIDPHPEVLDTLRKENRDISFAFSDERYYQAFESKKAELQLVRLCNLPKAQYSRVLYYAATHSPEEIQKILDNIHESLVPKKQTNIYIVMQTRFLEKLKSKPELWNYLVQHYSILKICLIDKKAVNLQPKKRCLIILHNAPGGYQEIQMQKTKLLDSKQLATLEFRRISSKSFKNLVRTFSELYDTNYIDYSKGNRRNKPEEYHFTKEISIWVSVCKGKDGRHRPSFSVYHFPTAEQLRKNTLPRGEPMKTSIAGKWYDSREEALAAAEEVLLKDEELAKEMCKAVKKAFEDKPISMKTHLFLHWLDLKERKNFDDGLCRSLFFVPNSADAPLCAMMVDSATEETVRMAMCGYETSNACSKTKSDKIWSLLEQLFDYVYIDRRLAGNPIRKLMQRKQETDKNRHDMRNNLVKDSFSAKTEGAFMDYLLSDKAHPVLAQMLITKYYTRLPNSILCALTWGDYLYDSELDLSQLAVTKQFPFRSLEPKEITPEDRKRLIPLVTPVARMIQMRIANGECKSLKHPLFSLPGTRNKPITPRALQDYFNSVLEKLDLPEYVIMILDEEKAPKRDDIDDYHGDILLRNFEYHARYTALMEPEAVDYLAGRKPRTTEAQYYCDYNNVYIQLKMRVQLDRWAAKLMPQCEAIKPQRIALEETQKLEISSVPSTNLNELYIELDIGETCESEDILLEIFGRYGGSICVDFYEEVE